MNLENLRAVGMLSGAPKPPTKVRKVYLPSSSSSSSEELWDLRRILEESPSAEIVREFIRANVECIEDSSEEGLFSEALA